MKGIGPVFRFNTYGRCALVGTADNAKESWQVGQVVEGGLGKKKDVRSSCGWTAANESRARHWKKGLDLHTSWGGGQFRHPDFPKSLGNRENP